MTPALLAGLLLGPAAPLDLDPEELQPGLVAEYRSLVDSKATVLRVEPKPAFTLGRSSPHPRLPPGPFEVTWNVDPHLVLIRLAMQLPLDEPIEEGAWRVVVSPQEPGGFSIERTG